MASIAMDVYWLEQGEADVPAHDRWLSAAEAARLEQLRFAKRRGDWRRGRWTAKRALAAYLRFPPDPAAWSGLEIRAAPCGAPEVFIEEQPAPVTISISHCGAMAACAVAPPGVALGCDVEQIELRSGSFVADYFTLEEQDLVARAAPVERPWLVTLLWSAKESCLKALQTGLRLDTCCLTVSEVEISVPRLFWRPLCVRRTKGPRLQGWWRYERDLIRTLVSAPSPMAPILLPTY